MCLPVLFAFAQRQSAKAAFNFGFEKAGASTGLAADWVQQGSDYKVSIDTEEKHSGNASMRIECKPGKINNSFGYCLYSIPAVYEGDQIEVRAYLKLQDVKNGSVGLLLRLDANGIVLKMENLQKENIQGTKDWALYSVKLPLPANATTINIGSMLSGTGKLWADDFEVLIDGKDIDKAKLKKLTKADQDTSFNNGSAIASIPLDARRIDDLTLLGKVWGFVKYHHPAVAAGEYNWDYELFRILPKIIDCRNKEERNEILFTWIDGLGRVKEENPIRPDSSLVKVYPDEKWIDAAVLGERLSALLHVTGNSRNQQCYYIGLYNGIRNPEFKNEKMYAAMHYPDAGFRLLALYRYWNIIQYYFPYKYLIEEDWNKVLATFIPKFVNAASELDYKLAALELIAAIHDTHANIWSYDEALENYRGNNCAPLEITFIENKAVVTGYLQQGADQQLELKKGDIITGINGRNTDSIVKERLPYTPASNYPTQLRDLALYLLRTNDTVLNITYQHQGTSSTTTIACLPFRRVYQYKLHKQPDTCFKYITPDIAYLYPGTMKKTWLPKVMPDFLKTKGMIIDMRCYPADDIYPFLSRYLLPDSTRFARIANAWAAIPGLFVFDRYKTVGARNPNYYKGRVVIIVNEKTQSAAEFSSLAFRVAPRATVIGSATAAADGNVSEFFLPGAIKTMISGLGIYYPDGRETQRVGIVPDITIQPTIQGIIEDRDEVLEKAIAVINEK